MYKVPVISGLKLGSVMLPSESQVLEHLGQLADQEEQYRSNASDCRRDIKSIVGEINEVENDELLSAKDKRLIINTLDKSKTLAVEEYRKLCVEKMEFGKLFREKSEAVRRKNKLSKVTFRPESPLDLQKSVFGKAEDGAVSLDLDCQFIERDWNRETNTQFASKLSSFVSAKTSSFFGSAKASGAGGFSVSSVASTTKKIKELAGTLVIVCNATHKNSKECKKAIFDSTKLVRAWNMLVDQKKQKNDLDGIFTSWNIPLLKMDYINPAKIHASIIEDSFKPAIPGKEREYLDIVSSATYGSSFIALVHVSRRSKKFNFQEATSFVSNVKASVDTNLWLSKASGDSQASSEIAGRLQSFISSVEVDAHCEIYVKGIAPTIKSNDITLALEELNSDPSKDMKNLQSLSDGNSGELESISKTANSARETSEFRASKRDYMANAIAALSKEDQRKNKVIDINSVMTALDHYIDDVKTVEGGVILGYGITRLSKLEIMKLWMVDNLQLSELKENKSEESEQLNENENNEEEQIEGGETEEIEESDDD